MALIYIYSPSGAVRDKAGFKRGIKHLQALGHEVEVDADALSTHLRFAGDDATRLKAISRAASSDADVVLISRGGYGLTRLLPNINYKQIAKSIENGKRWMGYSDFTALQSALFAKTDAASLSGASLIADFGSETNPDDIMQACFDDVLLGQNEGAGWALPKADRTLYENQSIKAKLLWGGNLSVLTSLIGTPYFPSAKQTKGGILFLEDVGESPYRIERLLTQWLHSGLLANQKAIVLGQFTNAKLFSHDKGFKLATVVTWLRSQLNIPVLTGLPFGHVSTKVMLPFGKPVRLLTDERDAMILWNYI